MKLCFLFNQLISGSKMSFLLTVLEFFIRKKLHLLMHLWWWVYSLVIWCGRFATVLTDSSHWKGVKLHLSLEPRWSFCWRLENSEDKLSHICRLIQMCLLNESAASTISFPLAGKQLQMIFISTFSCLSDLILLSFQVVFFLMRTFPIVVRGS